MQYKIINLILTIYLCLFSGCVSDYDYIPKASNYYKIYDNKIIYNNAAVEIVISGRYSRPVVYLQASVIVVNIHSRTDSLVFSVNELELNAFDLKNPFKLIEIITKGGRTQEDKFYIPPNSKHEFTFYHSIEDSSLSLPRHAIPSVELKINGLSSTEQSNEPINLPKFIFLSDSTENE